MILLCSGCSSRDAQWHGDPFTISIFFVFFLFFNLPGRWGRHRPTPEIIFRLKCGFTSIIHQPSPISMHCRRRQTNCENASSLNISDFIDKLSFLCIRPGVLNRLTPSDDPNSLVLATPKYTFYVRVQINTKESSILTENTKGRGGCGYCSFLTVENRLFIVVIDIFEFYEFIVILSRSF